MSESVAPVPDGFRTITPYLYVRNAPEAIAFYERAFGAIERFRLVDDDSDRVRHAEIELGSSRLFLTDVPLAPETITPSVDSTSPVWLYLYVSSPDALFDRAVAAGAEVVTPMGDQKWGDHYGCVSDPFGYRWGIASRRENLTPVQIKEQMRGAYRSE